MRVYSGGKRSGKTTYLILYSIENHYPIIVGSKLEATNVVFIYNQMKMMSEFADRVSNPENKLLVLNVGDNWNTYDIEYSDYTDIEVLKGTKCKKLDIENIFDGFCIDDAITMSMNQKYIYHTGKVKAITIFDPSTTEMLCEFEDFN